MKRLHFLRSKIMALIDKIEDSVDDHKSQLSEIHPQYADSALNLVHYKSLRKEDIRKIQRELGNLGLSRLAKSAPHVLASLYACEKVISALLKEKSQKPKPFISVKAGKKRYRSHTLALLGKKPLTRSVRIMVTVPSEAASDPVWAEQMLRQGMNCARINCAHDSAEVWQKMAENIKSASQKTGIACLICVDLCGPKIRTGAIAKGVQVLHISPQRDEMGSVVSPASIWIDTGTGESPLQPVDACLPIELSKNEWSELPEKFWLYLQDTRGKRRTLWVENKTVSGALAFAYDSMYVVSKTPIFNALNEVVARVGQLRSTEQKIKLKPGDKLILHSQPRDGEPAKDDQPANISCTAQEVFYSVKVGQVVKFDDGKITGHITEVWPDRMEIEISYTKQGGAVLGSDKGINFPQTEIAITDLRSKTEKT